MRTAMKLARRPLAWPIAAALAAATLVTSPAPVAAQAEGAAGSIVQVATGRGRMIRLSRPMSDLFVANSDIADVQVRSPTQLYVFGKKAGETTLSATTRTGAVVFQTTVRVGNNFDSINQMLGLAMPEAQVTATTLNGIVLLTGTVGSPDDAVEAERLVQAFVGEDTKVISRLRTATPLQVNLQVKFAEVSRSYIKNVGVRLTTSDRPGGGFLFGSDSGTASAGTITYDPTTGAKTSTYRVGPQRTTIGIAGRLLGTDILSAIDLGETLGQVSTLANPNLTALSGETATFLAGGEIPIPISQGLGAVGVEYKQFGVSLAYTPTVLSNGRISLRVRPEVSELSSDGAVQLNGTTIPALTTRRAETTLELGSGESMVIGGLLQNTHNNSIEKTPGLGDLPIIGALFRSNGFRRNETELVIVITPYLVRPVDPSQIALPTDGYRAPTDFDRIFLGQVADGQSGAGRPVPTLAPPVPAPPAVGAQAPVLPAPRPSGSDDAATPGRKRRGDIATPGFSGN